MNGVTAVEKAAVLAHLNRELGALRRPSHPSMVAKWLETLPPSALLPEAQALAREVAGIAGYGHQPAKGCHFARVTLDAIEVLIEYEAERGSPGSRDEPPEPAMFSALRVLINGRWLDAGIFDEDQHIKWEEEVSQQQQDAHDEDQIDAYIASREWT